jgi:hypothetical protein
MQAIFLDCGDDVPIPKVPDAGGPPRAAYCGRSRRHAARRLEPPLARLQARPWDHGLLIRRHHSTPEDCAYSVVFAPVETTRAALDHQRVLRSGQAGRLLRHRRSAARCRGHRESGWHVQRHPRHSTQPRGFGYVSGIIDPTTRVVSIFGVSRSEYQIPNNPGQVPSVGLTVDGVSDFDSALLNENQRQTPRSADKTRRSAFSLTPLSMRTRTPCGRSISITPARSAKARPLPSGPIAPAVIGSG